MSELPAGRELDALVAEKVMGWDITNPSIWWGNREVSGPFPDCDCTSHREATTIPEFSTGIAAAWEVVEKLKGQLTLQGPHSVGFNEGESYPNHWTAGFTDKAWDDIRGEANTAPLAICRAALKAVGANLARRE